jgi:hypothetical protein
MPGSIPLEEVLVKALLRQYGSLSASAMRLSTTHAESRDVKYPQLARAR